MRLDRIVSFIALALDLVSACLVGYLVYYFVAHTFQMLDAKIFAREIKQVFGQFNDFRAYYALGNIALSPDRVSIYDPAVQKAWYCRIATPEGASCDDYSQIPYAPFFPFAMLPFAQLPLNVSYVAWSGFGMVCFVAAIITLGFLPQHRKSRFMPFVIAIGSLASLPALRCLILGQSSLVITAMVAGFFYCWMRGNVHLAGVLMALTTFKLQFITFTLIPAIAQKQWKMLKTFVIAELILWGGSALLLGPGAVLSFFTETAKMGAHSWNQTFTMLCARSLFSYLPHQIGMALSAVLFLGGLAAVFRLWRKAPPPGSDAGTCWLVALTIVISLFTSMYTQLYDAMMLAIPAVLTLEVAGVHSLLSPGLSRKFWWMMLYTYPLVSWIIWTSFGKENPFTYHWFTLLLLPLMVIAFNQVLRREAASQGAPAADGSPQ